MGSRYSSTENIIHHSLSSYLYHDVHITKQWTVRLFLQLQYMFGFSIWCGCLISFSLYSGMLKTPNFCTATWKLYIYSNCLVNGLFFSPLIDRRHTFGINILFCLFGDNEQTKICKFLCMEYFRKPLLLPLLIIIIIKATLQGIQRLYIANCKEWSNHM